MPKIEPGSNDPDRARKGSRSVYRYKLGQRVDYPVYERSLLLSSDRIAGPAIIEEPSSTTVIHDNDILTVGQYGELIIETA
jgi:N-methylhydantoinase A